MKRTAILKRAGPIRSRPKPKREETLVPKNLGLSTRLYKRVPKAKDHMGRIAELGCIIPTCRRPAQVHHCDILTPKGLGPRVTGYLSCPLCPDHHKDDVYDSAHGWHGERGFWEKHGIDIGFWILCTLKDWYPDPDEHVAAAIAAIEKQREMGR